MPSFPLYRGAICAGLLSGLVILGVGGRVVMRLLAYTTPTPARFTAAGTLQVLALGTIWGGLTAPVGVLLHRWRSRPLRVCASGTVSFGLASLGLALVGSGGRLVAPLGFLLLGGVLFPLAHAWVVEWLATRWTRVQGSSHSQAAARTHSSD